MEKKNQYHKEYSRKYFSKKENKEKRIKYNKRFYQRDYLRNVRMATLEILGGKCVFCGISDRRVLQIDHVNGGGSKERKEKGFTRNFHKFVMDSYLNKENKYQLLCANCNWIKRFENKEAKGKIL